MRSRFIKPAYMFYHKVRGVHERLFAVAVVEFRLTVKGLSVSSCRPTRSRREGVSPASRVGDRSDLKVVVVCIVTFCNWILNKSDRYG